MTSRIDFHSLFVRAYTLMVGLCFGLGAVVLTGGEPRFSAPSFTGPKALVGWLPFLPPYAWWGALFILHGIVLVLSLGRSYAVHVLRFGIVVFWFLSFAFVVSAVREPTAGIMAVVAYAVFGALFLFLSDHLSAHGWGA